MICNAILTPIVLIVRTLIAVLRTIVRTVCGWVSSVITVIKTIVEKICKWLPWPFDKLCDWVAKTIEVLETVWDWVCRNILETIVDIIEIFTEYLIYILKWVCWVVDWVIRFPDLILCWIGIEPRRYITVCVKILADDAGTPAVPLATVDRWLAEAKTFLEKCDITLVTCGIEIIRKPELLESTTCKFTGIFSRFFTWFSYNSCGCCSSLTIYVVKTIQNDKAGCSYPGTDWLTLDSDADGITIVHEMGHLADMWGHNNDPNNLMHKNAGPQITPRQCCMIRTARFTLGYPLCRASAAGPDRGNGGGHDH